jgi:hypothetical protein
VKIKIPTYSGTARRTQAGTKLQCIKLEIKFVYKMKQIYTQLYHTHLHNTNTWHHTWIHTEHSINQELEQEITGITKAIENT